MSRKSRAAGQAAEQDRQGPSAEAVLLKEVALQLRAANRIALGSIPGRDEVLRDPEHPELLHPEVRAAMGLEGSSASSARIAALLDGRPVPTVAGMLAASRFDPRPAPPQDTDQDLIDAVAEPLFDDAFLSGEPSPGAAEIPVEDLDPELLPFVELGLLPGPDEDLAALNAAKTPLDAGEGTERERRETGPEVLLPERPLVLPEPPEGFTKPSRGDR